MNNNYQYVNNLWNDSESAELSGVDRLVYRSNKLGTDQRITNTGGGNTSSKILETDPLTAENSSSVNGPIWDVRAFASCFFSGDPSRTSCRRMK